MKLSFFAIVAFFSFSNLSCSQSGYCQAYFAQSIKDDKYYHYRQFLKLANPAMIQKINADPNLQKLLPKIYSRIALPTGNKQ